MSRFDEHSADRFLSYFREELQNQREVASAGRRTSTLVQYLEDATRPRHLTNILQVLNLVSKYRLDTLQPHFMDIVDVLVGWFLDTGTSEDLLDNIKGTFINFGPMWVDHANFANNLLERFGVDMMKIIQKESKRKAKRNQEAILYAVNVERPRSTDNLITLIGFARCYLIISSSLGPFYLNSLAPILMDAYMESMAIYGTDVSWLKEVNPNIHQVAHHLLQVGALNSICSQKIAKVLSHQLDYASHLLEDSNMIDTVLNVCGIIIQYETSTMMYRQGGEINGTGFSHHTWMPYHVYLLLKALARFATSSNNCKLMANPQLIIARISRIFQDVISATFVNLSDNRNENVMLDIIWESLRELDFSEPDAQRYISFLLTAVLGSMTNRDDASSEAGKFSVQGQAILVYILNHHQWIALEASCPHFFRSFLSTIAAEYQRCSQHKIELHIVAFDCIKRILHKTTSISLMHSNPIKEITLEWLSNVLKVFRANPCQPSEDVLRTIDRQLLKLGRSKEKTLRMYALECLSICIELDGMAMVSSGECPSSQTALIYEVGALMWERLSDLEEHVRNLALRVLGILINFFTEHGATLGQPTFSRSVRTPPPGSSPFWHFIEHVKRRKTKEIVHPFAMGSSQFSGFFDELQDMIQASKTNVASPTTPAEAGFPSSSEASSSSSPASPAPSSSDAALWQQLQRMYTESQLHGDRERCRCGRSPVYPRSSHDNLYAFPLYTLKTWATIQSAKHCVHEKLKTYLGTPQQTLEAMEKLVKTIGSSSLMIEENVWRVLSTARDTKSGPGLSQVPIHHSQLLMLLLCELEKQVYMIQEGIGNDGPSRALSSQQLTTFFLTNRKVCEEYFSRLRIHLVAAGARCSLRHSMVPIVTKNALFRLQDIKGYILRGSFMANADLGPKVRMFYEMEKVALAMAQAMVQKRDQHALEGIILWCKSLHGQLFASVGETEKDIAAALDKGFAHLLRGLLYESRQHWEDGVREYTQMFAEHVFPIIQATTLRVVIERAIQCYINCSDWDGFAKWVAQVFCVRDALQQESTDSNSVSAYSALMTAEGIPSQRNLILEILSSFLDSYKSSKSSNFESIQYFKALNAFNLGDYAHAQEISSSDFHQLRSDSRLSAQSLILGCLAYGQQLPEQATDPRRPNRLVIAPASAQTQINTTMIQLSRNQLLFDLLDLESPFAENDLNQVSNLLYSLNLIEANSWLLADGDKKHSGSSRHVLQHLKHVVQHPHLPIAKSLPVDQGEFQGNPQHQTTLSGAKAARKAMNLVQASKLLVTLGDESEVLYERAKVNIALAKKWHEDQQKSHAYLKSGVQTLHGIIQEDVGTDCKRLDMHVKALLRLGRLVQEDPIAEEQAGAILDTSRPASSSGLSLLLPAQTRGASHSCTMAQSRWLLEQSVALAPTHRPSLTAYGMWCVRNAQKAMQGVRWWAAISSPSEKASYSQAFKEACESRIHAIVCYVEALMGGTGVSKSCPKTHRPDSDIQLTLFILKLIEEQVQHDAKSLQIKSDQGAENGLDLLTGNPTLLRAVRKAVTETPILSWREVTLQLQAFLRYQQPTLQLIASEILKRIGRYLPHLLVYPMIAGLRSKQERKEVYQNTCDDMRSHSPVLTNNCVEMANELQRITVLLEEQWYTRIQGFLTTVSKISGSYNNFVAPINSALAEYPPPQKKGGKSKAPGTSQTDKEKWDHYMALMEPFVATVRVALDSLEAILNHSLSAYEEGFQVSCRAILKENLEAVLEINHMPDSDVDNFVNHHLTTLKDGFNNAVKALTSIPKSHPKEHSHKLVDLSPVLATMKGTCIPVPGAGDTTEPSGEYPTVVHWEPHVDVVQSKTKPKKLTLLASNGKRYTYLLKGREDLHLDQRIMQFLRVMSQLLKSHKQTRTERLSARHYAVVPIAHHSGLIMFVDGAIPIFALHRNWYKRKVLRNSSTSKPQESTPSSKATIFRPVDQFLAKLGPALKDAGIPYPCPRADWPVEVLRKVNNELQAEAPKDLLARELWCRPISATSGMQEVGLDGWYQRTRTFTGSYATMAMIGYILGLGDRHLDNIMMDFNTGDVVHIDYNICFGKGQRLRVPEVVPCRLTPIIQTALGIHGLNGGFRACSETVLEVMRANRHMLLMLLEAFVHAPLVEWTDSRSQEDMKYPTDLLESVDALLESIRKLSQPVKRAFMNMEKAVHASRRAIQTRVAVHNEQLQSTKSLDRAQKRLEYLVPEYDECLESWNFIHARQEALFYPKAQAQYIQARTLIWDEALKYRSQHQQHEQLMTSLLKEPLPLQAGINHDRVSTMCDILIQQFPTAAASIIQRIQEYESELLSGLSDQYYLEGRVAEVLQEASSFIGGLDKHIQSTGCTSPTEYLKGVEGYGPSGQYVHHNLCYVWLEACQACLCDGEYSDTHEPLPDTPHAQEERLNHGPKVEVWCQFLHENSQKGRAEPVTQTLNNILGTLSGMAADHHDFTKDKMLHDVDQCTQKFTQAQHGMMEYIAVNGRKADHTAHLPMSYAFTHSLASAIDFHTPLLSQYCRSSQLLPNIRPTPFPLLTLEHKPLDSTPYLLPSSFESLDSYTSLSTGVHTIIDMAMSHLEDDDSQSSPRSDTAPKSDNDEGSRGPSPIPERKVPEGGYTPDTAMTLAKALVKVGACLAKAEEDLLQTLSRDVMEALRDHQAANLPYLSELSSCTNIEEAKDCLSKLASPGADSSLERIVLIAWERILEGTHEAIVELVAAFNESTAQPVESASAIGAFLKEEKIKVLHAMASICKGMGYDSHPFFPTFDVCMQHRMQLSLLQGLRQHCHLLVEDIASPIILQISEGIILTLFSNFAYQATKASPASASLMSNSAQVYSSKLKSLTCIQRVEWLVDEFLTSGADQTSASTTRNKQRQQFMTSQAFFSAFMDAEGDLDKASRHQNAYTILNTHAYLDPATLGTFQTEVMRYVWLYRHDIVFDDVVQHIRTMSIRDAEKQMLMETIMNRKSTLASLEDLVSGLTQTVSRIQAYEKKLRLEEDNAIEKLTQFIAIRGPDHQHAQTAGLSLQMIKDKVSLRRQSADADIRPPLLNMAKSFLQMELLRDPSIENAQVQSDVLNHVLAYLHEYGTYREVRDAYNIQVSQLQEVSNRKQAFSEEIFELKAMVQRLQEREGQLEVEHQESETTFSSEHAKVISQRKPYQVAMGNILNIADTAAKMTRPHQGIDMGLHDLYKFSQVLKEATGKHATWIQDMLNRMDKLGREWTNHSVDAWEGWDSRLQEMHDYMLEEVADIQLASFELKRKIHNTEAADSKSKVPDNQKGDWKMNQGEGKNRHARKILTNVQEKLEGRIGCGKRDTGSEADAGERRHQGTSKGGLPILSVPQQVQEVIQQAMDPDSLAVMYEGWCAWI